jgi:pectinesterase
MDDFIRPEGWNNWNKKTAESTAFYAEYQCTGAGASQEKRVAWSHQLTDEQAQRYTIENILKGDDDWTPEITK